jgi:hypothetical protein
MALIASRKSSRLAASGCALVSATTSASRYGNGGDVPKGGRPKGWLLFALVFRRCRCPRVNVAYAPFETCGWMGAMAGERRDQDKDAVYVAGLKMNCRLFDEFAAGFYSDGFSLSNNFLA